jgi:hypothetical protein
MPLLTFCSKSNKPSLQLLRSLVAACSASDVTRLAASELSATHYCSKLHMAELAGAAALAIIMNLMAIGNAHGP